MRRIRVLSISVLFLFSVLLSVLTGLDASKVVAQQVPVQNYSFAGQVMQVPDLGSMSLSNFPALEEAGQISFHAEIEIVNSLGYNPSVSWSAGTPLANVLSMGTMNEAFGVAAFTPAAIGAITGGLPNPSTSLGDYAPIGWQTANTLMQAIPGFANLLVSDAPPLQKLFQASGIAYNAYQTISQVVQQFPGLGNLALGNIDLSQFSFTSIPGLGYTPIGALFDWQKAFASGIPGLSNVPLGKMPIPLITGAAIAGITDVVWGEAETGSPQAAPLFISGSGKKGGTTGIVPCISGSCPYLEISQVVGVNVQQVVSQGLQGKVGYPVNGLRWATGKQQVKGGWGLLQCVPVSKIYKPCYEPAGIMMFKNPLFKGVYIKTTESKGTGTFAFFTHFCLDGGVFVNGVWKEWGCTPYSLWPTPFPFFNAREKKPILIASLSSISPKLSKSTQAQLNQLQSQYQPTDNSSKGSGSGEGDCTTYRGVQIGAFKEALHLTESRQDNYQSVGTMLAPNGKATTWDVALGRYQFMDYRAEVRQVIIANGGQEWLNAIDAGRRPTSSEVLRYFPPSAQEQIMNAEAKRLIDLSNSRGYSGEAAVRVAGMMHHGGEGYNESYSDGYLTTGQYGNQILSDYKRLRPIDEQKCSSINNSKNQRLGFPISSNNEQEGGQTQAQAKIASAAQNSYGMKTSNVPGTNNGQEACAWAVNYVIQQAGYPQLGNNPLYVPSLQTDLASGRGTQVSASQARAGDIAIAAGTASGGGYHIGFCLNSGCTRILSNSSSRGSFSWISDGNFDNQYTDKGQTVIYRLNK
jgi:hypothetical protein